MFKKSTAFLAALLLLYCLTLPVCAATSPLIVDEAGLLTSAEIAILEERSAEIKAVYGIESVILTVDALDGIHPQDYADDYYDQAQYGDDGVLFLLAMAEREWYISTCGTVVYALTDYGTQQIGESVVPFLSAELWYDGFLCYLDSLPTYLDAYASGSPIDGYADYSGDYYHGDQEEILYYEGESTPSFMLSLLCGMVISGIAVFFMQMAMNSKRPQRYANEYIKDGSWNLTQHSDIFLYSNVTKMRKQEPPKSSGGGSSVHHSSSGRRHGGGGGKF